MESSQGGPSSASTSRISKETKAPRTAFSSTKISAIIQGFLQNVSLHPTLQQKYELLERIRALGGPNDHKYTMVHLDHRMQYWRKKAQRNSSAPNEVPAAIPRDEAPGAEDNESRYADLQLLFEKSPNPTAREKELWRNATGLSVAEIERWIRSFVGAGGISGTSHLPTPSHSASPAYVGSSETTASPTVSDPVDSPTIAQSTLEITQAPQRRRSRSAHSIPAAPQQPAPEHSGSSRLGNAPSPARPSAPSGDTIHRLTDAEILDALKSAFSAPDQRHDGVASPEDVEAHWARYDEMVTRILPALAQEGE